MASASFEALHASAADRVLNGTGREAFDAIKMLSNDPSILARTRLIPAQRLDSHSGKSRSSSKEYRLQVAFATRRRDTYINWDRRSNSPKVTTSRAARH
jgi:hypothetical protein